MKIAIVSSQPMPRYQQALANLGAETELLSVPFSPEGFEGLVLPGGGDVDPRRYGWENLGSKDILEEEDQLQLGALDAFVRAGKPVLGICRGHQLINVYFGGTLVQDLPTRDRHARTPGENLDKFHIVQAGEGSFLERIYGSRFQVNSAHHQAVALLGKGLECCAVDPEDGVAVAYFHREKPVWGVQFHPERMPGGEGVLRFFLEECQRLSI